MTDGTPDIVQLLLQRDYGLQPGAASTTALTASRAQAVERLLALPYSFQPELDDYFQPTQ
ncbi:MAG: hypothetical protein LUE17_00640 [Planctomycetaceae bacterium]|nr:hypothetical protein [Planctomycetaceae bacterium]